MLLLLLACTNKPPADEVLPSLADTSSDTADTGEAPPEDLGDPYLAMVAAVPPGILRSTCSLRIDLFVDGEAQGGEQITAAGGEWVGIQLSGDATYTATGAYADCTELNPTGTLDSGSFSGVAGYLFLFWYNGANAGYTTLVQTEDYSGGLAEVVLEEGADPAGVQAIADSLGVTLTLREGTTWDAVFPTELPVGLVLSSLSRDPAFLEGSPAWIAEPYWW